MLQDINQQTSLGEDKYSKIILNASGEPLRKVLMPSSSNDTAGTQAIILDSFGEPLRKVLMPSLEDRMIANQLDLGIAPQSKCPYDNIQDSMMKERFMLVWNQLKTPEEKEKMANNFRPRKMRDGQWGVEVIPLEKVFAPLDGNHNGEDIIEGSRGRKYFKVDVVKRLCREQGKKTFVFKKEVENFMRLFPSKDMKKRATYLAQLFDLGEEGSGLYSSSRGIMQENRASFIGLSINPETAWGWTWSDSDSHVRYIGSDDFWNFLVFEDVRTS